MLTDSLVHVGYVLMLGALLARDMLWLRVLLVGAQSLLAIYAYTHDVLAIAGWNLAFVVINAVWVVTILRERRAVRLPAELVDLHRQQFAALSPPEFLRLWESGEDRRFDASALVRTGERPQALYFVLKGEVAVRQAGRERARLGRGHFVGEMSLLTGSDATADVIALGAVETRAWSSERLLQLSRRNPALWTRIQSVLGRDIVDKIQRAQGSGEGAASSG